METERMDILCPTCAEVCNVRLPARVPSTFGTEPGRADVSCPTCGWEFAVDSEGSIADDGEAEPEAELEVTADGEIIPAEDDRDYFRPWHAVASLCNADTYAWRESGAESLEVEDYGEDWLLERRIDVAWCPGCGQQYRDVWPSVYRCPACNLAFSISFDPPDDDQGGMGEEFDFALIETPASAPFLRPFIVSPSGRGDFGTIEEAVLRAQAGRRILVRPGLYEESIDVPVPLEISGDGPVDQIIVVARNGPCFSLGCSTATIRGLTLRAVGQAPARDSPAVQVNFGNVEDCDITSAWHSCVTATDGVLRRCRIHDGRAHGIVAQGGRIEACEISRNGAAAVDIRGAACAVLDRCEVRDGYAEGVNVQRPSQAALIRCNIHGNARAGVLLRGERTLLWRCRIHDGQAEGIRIVDNGVGFVELCNIFGNRRAGLRVGGGNVYAWRSRVHDGLGAGVGITGHGVVDIRRCAVYRNAGHGIAVRHGVPPHVRRCLIRLNRRIAPRS